MRNRPKSDPVDPTPPMPRGESEFEERRIKTDFLAVFNRISNALFHSPQETHEYAYRCGFIAGKPKAGPAILIEGRKLPTYMEIV